VSPAGGRRAGQDSASSRKGSAAPAARGAAAPAPAAAGPAAGENHPPRFRIALVTDAWHPQVNGVVTTLSRVGEALEALDHPLLRITPEGHRTVAMPTYPDIRLALRPYPVVARQLRAFAPQAVHIATEGPLGQAARRWCRRHGMPFTTAYHTRFPQYLRLRAPIPEAWTYAWLRGFHAPAVRTLVPTPSMRAALAARGFGHLVVWSRGVDTGVFRPRDRGALDLPRPVAVYFGRVAVEKNLEAFLGLELPGSKLVVGEGPDLEMLRQRYPGTHFVGFRHGEDLAAHVAAADVCVFPSRTDTFGLTMLEAMACGVPVAAYPVTGPRDVVEEGVTGALDEDLGAAVGRALHADPQECIAFARRHTWAACAEQLRDYLAPIARPCAGDRPGRGR